MPVLENDESGKGSGGKAARSATSGRQGQRPTPELIDAIATVLVYEPRVKASSLYRRFQADDHLAPLLPYERAFRGLVEAARKRLDESRWSPAVAADDEEVRLVLPVLGRLQREEHMGPRLWVTPRTAKWIARLRRWDLKGWGAGNYLLTAVAYADRVERGADTRDLDLAVGEAAARGVFPELDAEVIEDMRRPGLKRAVLDRAIELLAERGS
jgi:hypothetical protein